MRFFLKILPILISVCLSRGCAYEENDCYTTLISAEEQIWDNPDEALIEIESLEATELSTYLQNLRDLLRLRALQREGDNIDPQALYPILCSMQQEKDVAHLGIALYTQAIAFENLQLYDSAICKYKLAEDYFPYLQNNYKGMIYYHEGFLYEAEQLYPVALDKYKRSLEYIEQDSNTLLLSCCLRDIARMYSAQGDSLQYTYFQQALSMAEQIPYPQLYYDILLQQEIHKIPMDSDCILAASTYMCDSLHLTRYAYYAGNILLSRGQTEKALLYFKAFCSDSILNPIYQQQYHLFYSRVLHAQGKDKDAYAELENIYYKVLEQYQLDGHARTFAIAKQYDVEKAQQQALRLQLEKQRLWIIIGTIFSCFTLLFIIGIFSFRQERAHRKQQEQAKHIAQLHATQAESELIQERLKKNLAESQLIAAQLEINEKRETLRKVLQQRIILSRHVRQLESHGGMVTASFQQLLNEFSFHNEKNWAQFRADFNDLYNNFLQSLKEHYPLLTIQDEQYIALSSLEIDSSDICFLLGLKNQSLWNRRTRLKKHLGDPSMDINEWLNERVKEIKLMKAQNINISSSNN